mgnify:CR=1 FL=1
MSAVAIINQLLFVFNLCIWGALAGAGIFGAQYYGQGNMEGVRQTLRMKLLIAVGCWSSRSECCWGPGGR